MIVSFCIFCGCVYCYIVTQCFLSMLFLIVQFCKTIYLHLKFSGKQYYKCTLSSKHEHVMMYWQQYNCSCGQCLQNFSYRPPPPPLQKKILNTCTVLILIMPHIIKNFNWYNTCTVYGNGLLFNSDH